MSLELIIIVPAHNEAKRLPIVLREYVKVFKAKEIKCQFVIVNNNSSDGTFGVIENLKLDNVSVISEDRQGKGRAVKTGFEKAIEIGCEYVGFVDADGSTTAKEFLRLYNVAKSFDGVIASRLLPGSQVYGRSFWRQVISRLFKLIRNCFVFIPFSDTQCGAKIFKLEAVKAVINDLTITDMAFDVQLLLNLYNKRYFIKEEPSIWVHTGDSATFSSPFSLIKNGWRMFLSLLKIKIRP